LKVLVYRIFKLVFYVLKV